jgi:RNA polymerase sigma-70 factor (ECF subfamily)
MLDRMPTDLRIAWMLRRVEGLALAEVASACDRSLATVKRRIAAADALVAQYVSIREDLP